MGNVPWWPFWDGRVSAHSESHRARDVESRRLMIRKRSS